ncbi:unnamed protein product [Miscanthus lutarioriparius]|uniref:Uncharacterized protein n=1 Tax=Miscanthus lutarioriparius TaxID=422564 RepID=A0A811RHG4_9POAL|nr:unnamed protein product [Miscanthus lutarioriparius]
MAGNNIVWQPQVVEDMLRYFKEKIQAEGRQLVFREVVRMQNDKDPRAKFINVPIHCYDEMEFIFQDKHETGEFTVLQAPYDLPSTQDGDLIGDKNVNQGEDVDPGLQYDSDCLAEEDGNNGGSTSSKSLATSKPEK